MSTVDTSDICHRCHGHTGFETPQCNCEDREAPLPWPRPSSKEEPRFPLCPRCKSPYRTRLDRGREGVRIYCGNCGFMEQDLGSLPYQMKICRSCGRVPKARVVHDMPDKNTLDFTYMMWQCCGICEPVWPPEVLLWCHIYIEQEERK